MPSVGGVYRHARVRQRVAVCRRQERLYELEFSWVRINAIHLLDRVQQNLAQQAFRAAPQYEHAPRLRMLAHPEVRQRRPGVWIGKIRREVAIAK
jgi:hypothetical protein